MPQPLLSIIVPVYNEEGAAASLHAEILSMANGLRPTANGSQDQDVISPSAVSCKPLAIFEIIFVNDGSKDRTMDVLKTLSPIKIINLRKNFGQTAAMDAGIKASTGRYIATLDGDGQNNPTDIPRMIEKLERDDLDVVNGWRKDRQDATSKRWASRCQAWLRKRILDDGVHDSGCSLKVYRRECFEHVHLYGEMHRFIAAILKMQGFKVGEEIVDHRERRTGKSKYGNFKRMIKGNLDMFAVAFWQKYSARPLHLFGGAGIVLMAVSALAGTHSIYLHLRFAQDLSDSGYTYLSMFGFFIGLTLFCFGLISDVLMRTYYESTGMRPYTVREVLER